MGESINEKCKEKMSAEEEISVYCNKATFESHKIFLRGPFNFKVMFRFVTLKVIAILKILVSFRKIAPMRNN